MKLRLLAAGTRLPAWVNAGFADYADRLPSDCKLELTEITLGHRGKNADIQRAIRAEGERMLAALDDRTRVIALEVTGKAWNTQTLAQKLNDWRQDGRDVALLIGGPDGLAPACRERAEIHWSLSALTLPHGLVRIIVAEQIYRAWSILNNHPYHRA